MSGLSHLRQTAFFYVQLKKINQYIQAIWKRIKSIKMGITVNSAELIFPKSFTVVWKNSESIIGK